MGASDIIAGDEAQIICLAAVPHNAIAFHAAVEKIMATAIVDPVDKGVSDYSKDGNGGRHGLPDNDESRRVVAHQGEDDDDAEQ